MDFKHYSKNILTFSTMNFDKETHHYQRFILIEKKLFPTFSTSLARVYLYGTFFSGNFRI